MAITRPHRHSSQSSPNHAAAGGGPEEHPSYNISMEDITNLENLFGNESDQMFFENLLDGIMLDTSAADDAWEAPLGPGSNFDQDLIMPTLEGMFPELQHVSKDLQAVARAAADIMSSLESGVNHLAGLVPPPVPAAAPTHLEPPLPASAPAGLSGGTSSVATSDRYSHRSHQAAQGPQSAPLTLQAAGGIDSGEGAGSGGHWLRLGAPLDIPESPDFASLHTGGMTPPGWATPRGACLGAPATPATPTSLRRSPAGSLHPSLTGSPLTPRGTSRGSRTPRHPSTSPQCAAGGGVSAAAPTSAGGSAIIRTYSADFMIHPRTGECLRFGPAMRQAPTSVQLPGVAALFADIASGAPSRPWDLRADSPPAKASGGRELAGLPAAMMAPPPGPPVAVLDPPEQGTTSWQLPDVKRGVKPQSDAAAAAVRQAPGSPSRQPTHVTRAAFQAAPAAAQTAAGPAPAATAKAAARLHADPPQGPLTQPTVAAATMSGESVADDTGGTVGLLDWTLPALDDPLLGSDQQTPHGRIHRATYQDMQSHQRSSTTAHASALQLEATKTL